MKKKYLIVLFVVGVFAGMVFLPRDFGFNEEKIFQVKKGQGIGEISANLEKEKLVWWGQVFKVYAFLTGQAGNLQAGCYLLLPSMNTPKVTSVIASGDIAKKKITIPEGFTSLQILQRLNETRLISGASTPGVFPSTPGVNPEISLVSWEGYLFPDTYEIPYCTEQEKIVEIMTANFDKKTADLKITHEVIVMASLLEKELKTKEDKEIAAGILWKRLRVGMPLQVDAFMWTYEHYGLPEKPISNPGIESIKAALYPKESSYFYYLSAPNGKTIFSRTLEEHNIAKARYLK